MNEEFFSLKAISKGNSEDTKLKHMYQLKTCHLELKAPVSLESMYLLCRLSDNDM